MNKMTTVLAVVALMMVSLFAHARTIGKVDVTRNLVGSNDRIEVEAFADPGVPGVTCHLSRAVAGGLAADVGFGEDKSNASIACRQTGPINLPADIKSGRRNNEQVFKKSTGMFFKAMNVVRMYDKKADTLIYLVYSRKLIDGSPKNSISTVPLYSPVKQ